MGPHHHSNGSEPGPSHTNGHSPTLESNLAPTLLSQIRPVHLGGRLMYPDDEDWLEHQSLAYTHDSGAESKKKVKPTGKRMPVDREEVVRLILQGLRDIGYHQTADVLQVESGYSLSSQPAIDFQAAVLGGRWAEALSLLPDLGLPSNSQPAQQAATSSSSSIASGKTKARSSDGVHSGSRADRAKFLISEQKYLELLETGQQNRALVVLRKELTPVIRDKDVLRDLSGYMVCLDRDDLYERASWDGAAGTSRRRLLENLEAFISPTVMVPSRRLATLFDQARRHQQLFCAYHEEREPTTLYLDHECDSGQFPTVNTHILADHSDEIWRIEWSPDGMKLASAGKDRKVVIWQLQTPRENGNSHYGAKALHHFRDHVDPIDALAWSPDGKTIVTGAGKIIMIWDVETGTRKSIISQQPDDQISTIQWMPDGQAFVVASLDKKISFYNASGAITRQLGLGYLQATDFVITPDGQRIVAITNSAKRVPKANKLRPTVSSRISENDPQSSAEVEGFKYEPMEHNLVAIRISDQEILELSPDLKCDVTSIKLSHDGLRVLISCAPDELQVWNIDPVRFVRRHAGHIQNQFLIRSCFGGARDRFVLSGSEDGQVYVWQGNNPDPIEVLHGHDETVNAVAWNPITSRRLFASCSDDHSIRIWQPPVEEVTDTSEGMMEDRDDDEHAEGTKEGNGIML